MYEVVIKDVPDQRVAAVHVHAAFGTIGEEVRTAFETLGRAVGVPNGMPFLMTDAIDAERGTIDVDVCFPVAGPVPTDERVDVLDVPAARVATTVHRGPYAEVGPAYEALEGWIEAHGQAHAGPPRELYLNDPGEAGQEAALTEIQMPIHPSVTG